MCKGLLKNTVQRHTHLSQCSLHAVAGNDDPVPLVGAPGLEQLPGEAALHHPGAGHDHTGTNVIKVLDILRRLVGTEGYANEMVLCRMTLLHQKLK